MNRVLSFAVVCSIFALASVAQAKSCDELKSEIYAKLDAKGVAGYTLNAVPNEEVKPEDKVIGSCEGGTQKIVYTRG